LAVEGLDLACSTACFAADAREEELVALAEAGAKRCEISLPADEQVKPGHWTTLLDAAGLRCWSYHVPFGSGWDLSSPDAETRSRALGASLRAVDLGASLGAKVLVVHGGAEPVPEGSRAQHLAAAQDSLHALADRCQILGRKLALEFLPRSCPGNSVSELEYLLSGMDREVVGVCLDLNHANLGQDLVTNVLGLAGRIITIHVSDNDGVDERHWLPGQGIIDWPSAVAALVRAGYTGPSLYESGRDKEGAAVTAQRLQRNYDEMIAPHLQEVVAVG